MTKEQMRRIIKKHAMDKKRAEQRKAIAKKVDNKKIAMKEAIAERKKIAKQTSILADRFAKKLDARMEKILLDAETLVKQYFPAKYVSA